MPMPTSTPTRHLTPYLSFAGTCAEAFHFYEKALGATIESLMQYRDSPMAAQVPPSHLDKVLHATLRIDGQAVMASDTMPDRPHHGLHGFSLSLDFPTVAAAEAAYAALGEGGVAAMPLGPTFFAAAFGMVVDRFGVPWMLICEKPA